MKRIVSLALVILGTMWLPVVAQDADRLFIRMVAAGQGQAVEDPELKDVLPLLKNTLRFSSFTLLGKDTVRVANQEVASLPKGYKLSLDDVDAEERSMTVTVTKGRKEVKLLETRLKLRPKRPVIVGGFDDDEGTKVIIILKLQ